MEVDGGGVGGYDQELGGENVEVCRRVKVSEKDGVSKALRRIGNTQEGVRMRVPIFIWAYCEF